MESQLFGFPRVLQDVVYECRLCDMGLQYFLENGKCVGKTKENCTLLSLDQSTCLICQKDYFWNQEIQKCQTIPTTKKIDNCFSYDEGLNCINCNQNFYLSSGKCSAVSTTIKGCLVYEDASNCAYCDLGYMLDRPADSSLKALCKLKDGKLPEEEKTEEGASEGTEQSTAPVLDPVPCKKKSFFECDKCESSYFLDYNYRQKLNYKIEKNYLDILALDIKSRLGVTKSSILTMAMSTELKAKYDASPFDLGAYSPCVKGFVDFCAVFETFDKCLTCNENYYKISDGTCVPQPAAPITNCQIYASESVCQTCQDKYYLGPNGGSCVEVTDVENCSKYEGVSNKCAECNSKTLFVNTDTNKCDTRTNYPIDKCSSFNKMKDECEACESDYLITTAKTGCLKIPTDCMTYAEDNGSVKCSACKELYFLQNNECIKGSISDCKVYDQTQVNKCSVCEFKFYLNSSGSCTNFSKVVDADCSETGQTDNECAKCKNHKFAVTRPKRCVQVQNSLSSPGCLNFNVDGNCIECKDHYFGTNCQFKNSDTTIGCTKFSNNSDTVGESNCLICTRESHYLDQEKCQSRHSLSLKNCKISQLDKNECQICESDSGPRNAKKLTSCVAMSSLSLSTDIQSNCEVYDMDTSKCQVCKSTHYLDSSSNCVTTCPNGKIKVDKIYQEIDQEMLYFGNQCVDKPSDLENCDENSIVVQPPKNIICTKCKSGFQFSFDAFSGTGYVGSTNLHNYDTGNSSFDAKSSFTSLGCEDETLPKGKNTSNQDLFTMENCEIFSKNNNHLYCSKCVFGKVGKVSKDSFGNKSISSCTAFSSFDANTQYESISYAMTTRAQPPLSHGLDVLFSVHKCTDANKIVYATVKLKTTSTASKFVLDISDITQTPAHTSTMSNSTNFSQVCEDKSLLQGDDLTNCILGVIDIESSSQNRHYCVACAPGYRADGFHSNNIYIKKCSLITNCTVDQTSLTANTCKSCSTSAWLYSSSTSQVLFDQCTSKSVPNCLLNDSLNNSLCSVCKKGYFLSIDKTKCMDQTEENCVQKGSDFLIGVKPDLYPNTYARTLTFLSENLGKKRGCEECTSNHIKIGHSKYLCEKNINLIEHTISNCKKPIIDDGTLTCIECQTGFIPRNESKECIEAAKSDTYVNCDLLENTASGNKTADGHPIYPCKICNSEYLMSQRLKCDIKKITHCDEHDTDTGKCKKCQEGYLLAFDECTLIPSDELCVKFDNQKNCIQCKTDYELVIIEEGDGASTNNSSDIKLKSECIVTGFSNKCSPGKNKISYDLTNQNYKEECTECLSGYTLLEKDGTEQGDDYSKCYPVPFKDDNCDVYHSNSLMCKTCKSNYYISTKNSIAICVEIDPVPDCTTYIENTNTCSACRTGYFLNSDTRLCVKNPAGILNCLKYETQEICSLCSDKFYLDNNECKEVPADNLIADCSAYKSSTECLKCTTNKVPNASALACETITENSCLTWIDAANCETCPEGKVLNESGGKKTCGDFTIDFCAKVDTTNKTCSACSPGYYATSSTACAAASATIDKCQIYSSADKCGECEAGYMLKSGKDECVSIQSLSGIPLSNCSVGHEIAAVEEGASDPGFCFECNNGYLKIDGKCEECGVKKCRYCDPSDKNVCSVCLSGYFMAEDGKCMSNTGDDEEEPTTPPEEEESVSIRASVVVWVMLSVLLLKP